MADTKTAGFTLIELMLFLALTGLFMLIAFAGISGRSGNVQFSDSMRSLGNFLQRQYNDTLNGVNSRGVLACSYDGSGFSTTAGTSQPGQSNCTVIGRAVVFSDDSATADVYLVVGRFLTQATNVSANYLDPSLSDLALIQRADPTVLRDTLNQTYELEWGSTFQSSGSNANTVVFLRSPRSSSVYPLSFSTNWTQPNQSLGVNDLTASANYCFLGANGQDAQVNLGGTNLADVVAVQFDTGCS